jgi:hypothetical protein
VFVAGLARLTSERTGVWLTMATMDMAERGTELAEKAA